MEVIALDDISVSISGDYHETLLWVAGDGVALRDAIAFQSDADAIMLHQHAGGTLVEVKSQRPLNDAILNECRRAGLVGEVRALAPVLPVLSQRSTSVPFTSCTEMLRFDAGRGTPLWQLGVQYEAARGCLSERQLLDQMIGIIRILRRSIAQGIAGTHYEDRVLGHQSGQFQARMLGGGLLGGGSALNRIVLYVTALMEVKSAMGVIVAAPTAGACAALPGAVIAMAEDLGLGEEDMAKAMLASGVIGVFIATKFTFAAEVGGCQVEGGSAASMAAAALVSLAGGTLAQSLAAASMALQNMIGLICDPVANRVEVPCLGKNVMAASNALSCANLALSNFDPVIPLDEVIETVKRVAAQMPRELRCTSLGGLAITPTSLALEARLAQRKGTGCGTTECGCG
jgi:L-serine dehydratase